MAHLPHVMKVPGSNPGHDDHFNFFLFDKGQIFLEIFLNLFWRFLAKRWQDGTFFIHPSRCQTKIVVRGFTWCSNGLIMKNEL